MIQLSSIWIWLQKGPNRYNPHCYLANFSKYVEKILSLSRIEFAVLHLVLKSFRLV